MCVYVCMYIIERSLGSFCDYDTEVLCESGKNACCSSEASKGKGKAIPVQVWTGSEGSRRLRLPDFMTAGSKFSLYSDRLYPQERSVVLISV